jgi:predicted ATPase
VQRAKEQTDVLIRHTQQQGIPQFSAMGTILRGWTLAKQGREEGVAQLQQGLAGLRDIGQELGRPYFLALRAEAHRDAGQLDEGIRAVTEALQITHASGECMHQAELYRLKGQLTPPTVEPEEIEAYFLEAIAIAQRQRARSLELRATTSLARLWRQHGKSAEGRQRLAEVYDWFSEGFDTADLVEARVLLGQL